MNKGLRLLSFLVSKISIIILALLLIILTFFTAYDVANIYVLANDALSERTKVVLNKEEEADAGLDRFFTLNWLNSDPLLSNKTYDDYIIRDYNYNLKVKKLWVWPWQSKTSVIVEESIPDSSFNYTVTDDVKQSLINAQLPEDADDEEIAEVEASLILPKLEWQNGLKQLEYKKIDGQWKIDRIIFLEELEEADTSDKPLK